MVAVAAALAAGFKMDLLRKIFLGSLGLFFLFFAYVSFFDVRPNSFNIGRIFSLPLGPVINTDALLFYNEAGAFSSVVEGDAWRTDRFLRMAVKTGENSYPGITFYLRESIPPDARLLIHWRARGKPGRVLVDVTDGPSPRKAAGPGENYFVYSETPGEAWQTSTFPLARFERNPTQPQGAPKDGTFNTEGIQAVSFTFFPLSDFTLDVREVSFVWKTRHGYSSALVGIVLALGILLWWRTTEGNIRVAGTREPRENAAIARVVFVFLAFLVSVAALDGATRLTGIAPLSVFGLLCGLVLLDDRGTKAWMKSRPWALRYFSAALAGWYLDFTHNPVLLGLLLCIALVPLVTRQSRWALLGGLAIAGVALVAHPGTNLSGTLVTGTMIISAIGVIAFLAFEMLQQQRATREARYIRSLYQEILEHTSDGVYLLDSEGRIEAANPGFAAMLGRPGAEIIGKNLRELVHEDDVKLLEPSGASLAGPRQFDLRFVTREGKVRIGLVREAPVFSGGFLSGYQAVATDITERKKAEIEREKLLKELQLAMAEAKSQKGFLPICAVCKKIRDEAGEWNRIERYISAHFNTQFSHGICPECLETHYPGLLTELEVARVTHA